MLTVTILRKTVANPPTPDKQSQLGQCVLQLPCGAQQGGKAGGVGSSLECLLEGGGGGG